MPECKDCGAKLTKNINLCYDCYRERLDAVANGRSVQANRELTGEELIKMRDDAKQKRDEARDEGDLIQAENYNQIYWQLEAIIQKNRRN